MNVRKLFSVSFYRRNKEKERELIEYDYKFNAAFRGENGQLPKSFLKSYEWETVKAYRKFQANKGNIWRQYYSNKLNRLEEKSGIHFEGNDSIGKGLIIGHWGRIIFNGQAHFGAQLFVTHNVTVGRDIRGKHKGVPTFGDRVCIRTNSTVVGNIHIGNDVLVAPNTFVNFDVPDHSIVIGNPATIHHRDNATKGHIPEID